MRDDDKLISSSAVATKLLLAPFAAFYRVAGIWPQPHLGALYRWLWEAFCTWALSGFEGERRTTAAKLIFVMSTLYLAGGVLGQKHRNGRWGWISPGVAAEQTDVLLRDP